VRQILYQHAEGMTSKEIMRLLNMARIDTANRVLTNMPDTYVDRWIMTRGSRGQYQAVWCIVRPPANCPYPTDRKGD